MARSKNKGGRPAKEEGAHYVSLVARIPREQRSLLELMAHERKSPISKFVREAIHLYLICHRFGSVPPASEGSPHEFERNLFEKMLDLLSHENFCMSRSNVPPKKLQISIDPDDKEKRKSIDDAVEFFLEGIKRMAPQLLKNAEKNAAFLSKYPYEEDLALIAQYSDEPITFEDDGNYFELHTQMFAERLEIIVVISYLLSRLKDTILEQEKRKWQPPRKENLTKHQTKKAVRGEIHKTKEK